MPPFSSVISRVTRSAIKSVGRSVVLSTFRRPQSTLRCCAPPPSALPVRLSCVPARTTHPLARISYRGGRRLLFATATVSTP